MRYYKYRFESKIARMLLKKRVAEYSEKQKRNHYFRTIFFTIDIGLFFAAIFGLSYLTSKVAGSSFNVVIRVILCMFLCLLILILPVVIVVGLAILIDKIFPYEALPQIQKRMLDECMAPVKKYYHLPDTYLITKCYDSNCKQLINRDLILYQYNNKLRIINDLTRSIKDLGCYEFSLNEIEVSYGMKDHLITTELSSKKLKLVLVRKAKPFIIKKVF